jgi:NHLM bacteriocin system ABC transporter ATP-binding protein
MLCRINGGVVTDTESEMRFDSDSGWFPVNEATCLAVLEEAVLDIQEPDSVFNENVPQDIARLCRVWILQRARARWDNCIQSDEERIRAWIREEARISEYRTREATMEIDPADEARVVFDKVLRCIQQDLSPKGCFSGRRGVPGTGNLFSDILSLAESAGVRVRRVRLHDSWWKGDHGPLLVESKDHKLFAAIPTRAGQYQLHDGAGATWESEQIQDLPLSQTAYMLYPSLPDRPVTARDLILFAFSSIWKEDLLALVIYAIAAGLLTTAIPIATGLLFSFAIPHGNTDLLYGVVLALCMTIAASAIFSYALDLTLIRIQGSIGRVMEAAIWDRVLKLPPSFFRKYNAGELASMVGIIDEIQKSLAGVMALAVFGVTYSVFNIILIFIIFPPIAWVMLLFTLGGVGITIVLGWLSFRLKTRLLSLQGHLTGTSFQMLKGIAKITSSGAQNRAYMRWEIEYMEQISLKIRLGNYRAYSRVFSTVWPGILTLLVFLLASEIIANRASVSNGWFLAFFAAVGAFSAAFASLGDAFIVLYDVRPMWARMAPILEAQLETRAGNISPGKLAGAIEVSHVSFRFSPDTPLVLTDVSFMVSPGEFVAIVGTSGGGKSTLLRILLGFEEPYSGSVLYDGQNLARLNIHEVRKQTGAVLQDGQLMADTIFNNIAASRSLSQEEAWNAARMAGIDDDINAMPLGMQTIISEGATNISGGQRQRILIARALASQPRIIFFDEATSSLDNIAQKTVRDSIQKLHLTRVIIAHRISTIENADRIYVLEEGKIAESGTFDELMAKGGVFSRIARRQIA